MGIQSKRIYSTDESYTLNEQLPAPCVNYRCYHSYLWQCCARLRHFESKEMACSQSKCVDLCFSEDCNQEVNNARDKISPGGYTPLLEAAYRNRTEVAKQLIAHSADVNYSNGHGETALHYAASWNNVEMAKDLLANSANVDSTTYRKGETAFHYAAGHNSVEVANFLLDHSVNVDSTDNRGYTALHFAVRELFGSCVSVAKLLIAHSADLNATPVSGPYKGLTPLQAAEKEGHQEMVELLRNA